MKQGYARIAKEEQKRSRGNNTPPLDESFQQRCVEAMNADLTPLASANDELHRMGRAKARTITEGQEISCVGNRRPNLRTYQ